MADPAEGFSVPQGKSRSRIIGIFVAFAIFQLIMPLTYYLREDAYDERFAWRMFSAVRLHSCRPSAEEDRGNGFRPVALDQVIHRGWINHLSRNRRDVVIAFLERRCDEEGVITARVRNQCANERGERLEEQMYIRSCATGEVELPTPLILAEPESAEESP